MLCMLYIEISLCFGEMDKAKQYYVRGIIAKKVLII